MMAQPNHDRHDQHDQASGHGDAIPASTSAPVLFAFGTTLVFAGLVTSWMVSVAGLLMSVWGILAWWFDVFPRERMEPIPSELDRACEPPPSATMAQAHASPGRLVLPVEVPRYRSGVKGGLAGGAAMAAVALVWGLLFHGSIWLPINLLAGMVIPSLDSESLDQLRQFQIFATIAAVAIHLVFSLFVGLLFGVAVPLMPRRPILMGGVVAPLFWTGLIISTMKVVDPVLAEFVDWWWFVASQFAFGIVAGWVVARSEKVETLQYLTPAERMELETNQRGEAN